MQRITVIIEFDEIFRARSINDNLTLGLCASDDNLEPVKLKYRQLVDDKINELVSLEFSEPIEYLLQFKLLESAVLKTRYTKKLSIDQPKVFKLRKK